MNLKLAIPTLCILPLISYAVNAEEAKPEYTASAELGFLYKTGNTKSGDVKAGLNLKHQKDKWRTEVAFNILAKKLENDDDEFETTDNKWDIVAQTNYTIGEEEKNYLYGNLAYEQDKFSGFESQSSFSAGWGRNWHETETSSFFADIGPGVTHDVTRATTTKASESSSNLIIQAQAVYTHKFNEHVKFKQYFVAKQATESGENSIYKSETSVTAQLIDALQLKFALRINYDTEVEPEYENTNTETSMTLIYNF